MARVQRLQSTRKEDPIVASTARSSSGRPTQAKSRGAGAAKSAAAAKRSSSSADSRSAKRSSSSAKSKRSSPANSRSRATASANRSRSAGSRSANGSGANGAVSAVTETIGSAARKATTPILAGGAAAVGLVGGIVLGKRVLGPRRTVLGIPVSRKGLSLQPVAKEVQKAGQQIGRLTDELAQARKQAKKVGDALS
jgi:1-aminocyclopropane-1-carboxylate deaminase/D-cysteine desulfhydrase-like pyridoxal-dependent ACC family enzyme